MSVPRFADRRVAALMAASATTRAPLSHILSQIAQSPKLTTLRLSSTADAGRLVAALAEALGGRHFAVRLHRSLPDVIEIEPLVHGVDTRSIGTADNDISSQRVVCVDARAGEALLRGSHLFAPGVLSCFEIARKDPVLVVADVSGTVRKGTEIHGIVESAATSELSVGEGVESSLQSGQITDACIDRQKRLPRIVSLLPMQIDVVLCGAGYAAQSRAEMLRPGSSGIAVSMLQPGEGGVAFPEDIFSNNSKSLSEFGVFLQNEPSVAVGHAVDPRSGERILDMCAAPGGKATHLAALMARDGLRTATDGSHPSGPGIVVAIDRSKRRTEMVADLNFRLSAGANFDILHALALDSTKLPLDAKGIERISFTRAVENASCELIKVQSGANGTSISTATPPSLQQQLIAEDEIRSLLGRGESFDRVLLDAPCSGLGQRPRLREDISFPNVLSSPRHQRSLFHAAHQMLRPGGVLVYSTCTMHEAECEGMVAWALSTFPDLRLAELPHCVKVLGGPGLTDSAEKEDLDFSSPSAPVSSLKIERETGVQQARKLTASQAMLVRRWDPIEHDTIAFFLARFEKAV